eukprot:5338739-Heterocapsa_arctica.AAC.1
MHGSCGTAILGSIQMGCASEAATPSMRPIYPRFIIRVVPHPASCISHCPPWDTHRTVESDSSGSVGQLLRSSGSPPPAELPGSVAGSSGVGSMSAQD